VRRNGLLLPEFRDGFFVLADDIRSVLAATRDDLGPRGRDAVDHFLGVTLPPLEVVSESLIRLYAKATVDEAVRIVDRLYPLRLTVPPLTPRPERRRHWWQRRT
jgi:hypothetical protein